MSQAMLDCGQCSSRKYCTISEEQLRTLHLSGSAFLN